MKRFILALTVVALTAANTPAHALKISPFKMSIPAEDSHSHIFRLENNADESAAVQVRVTTWKIMPDGAEVNENADADFVIFPAQVVIPPRETRAVRVQYTGDRADIEKPYRLIAEQLPVDLRDTGTHSVAVRFLLRLKAALYITPQKAKDNISIDSTAEKPDGTLRLHVVNTGTAHAILRDPAVTLLLNDGSESRLKTEQVTPIRGENIHAAGERYLDIHLPPELRGRVRAARIDTKTAF